MTEHEQPAERDEPEVEAHRRDSEAPKDLGELREGGDGSDEPDVEAHRKKFH